MTKRTLHTERLDLTPWGAEYLPRLQQLARTPDLAQMISRGEAWTPLRAQALSDAMAHHWESHGFGWRAMVERGAGQVTGFVGVAYTGRNESGLDAAELEFGCWVHPTYWRRGLALEASVAVLDEAFHELGASGVIGCARSDHQPSVDGALALGFQFDRQIVLGRGLDTVVLRVTAGDWARTRQRARA